MSAAEEGADELPVAPTSGHNEIELAKVPVSSIFSLSSVMYSYYCFMT